MQESNLGFSEKQISYLMSVTDSDEDGIIDYEEFTSLFFDVRHRQPSHYVVSLTFPVL